LVAFALVKLYDEYVHKASQAGQIGVIILLIMVVLLTIGLSVAARTTQDLALSQQGADSARVFNAAEAGIEKALSSELTFEEDSSSGEVTSIDNVDVNYTISKRKTLETRLFEGLNVMVDLTGIAAITNPQLKIEWSKEDNCSTQEPASLVVTIFSGDATDTKARTLALAGCARSDGFTTASSINVDGYRRSTTLTLNSDDLFVRVKPVYSDTHVRITGVNWELPVQYFNVRSEARSNNGNETRIVEVNRTLPTAPSVMDFALYSGADIVKN